MRKRSNPRIGLVVLALLFAYCAYTAVGQQKMIYAKRIEAQKMQNKLKDEQKTNDDLKKQQSEMDSDSYIEKIAREKLGMVKQGERVYVDIGK